MGSTRSPSFWPSGPGPRKTQRGCAARAKEVQQGSSPAMKLLLDGCSALGPLPGTFAGPASLVHSRAFSHPLGDIAAPGLRVLSSDMHTDASIGSRLDPACDCLSVLSSDMHTDSSLDRALET